jgi:hypothetical protein
MIFYFFHFNFKMKNQLGEQFKNEKKSKLSINFYDSRSVIESNKYCNNLVYSVIYSKYPKINEFSKLGKKLFYKGNLCLNSLYSEMVSVETIVKFLYNKYSFISNSILSETEIKYNTESKKTDYILFCNMPNDKNTIKISVQVKRIHEWNDKKKPVTWNSNNIINLLEKTNKAVKESNYTICKEHSCSFQILHILTSIKYVYDILKIIIKHKKFDFKYLIISFIPDKKSMWILDNTNISSYKLASRV